MKITINGKPKEIAALVLELQGQQKDKTIKIEDVIQKQINIVSNASEECVKFDEGYALLPALTEALVELHRL